MLFQVSSFTYDIFNTLLFSDAHSKKAVIPTCSPRSEFAVTLVASRPEDAFIDLLYTSILGATKLSIAVKIAFWILSSTVSSILLISLSVFSIKQFSQVFTFSVFSLVTQLLPEVPTVKSRSLETSLSNIISRLSLAMLPIVIC